MHESENDGFSSLWPTTFLRRAIPNTESANAALLENILEMESDRGDMTVDYLAENLFAASTPATEWLKKCIDKTVADFLKHLGINYAVEWSVQGWANVNRRGDYHNLHNHPHSYLSGTYYVKVPQQPAGYRSDLNPASISFFDPRPQANMGAIASDGQIDPELRIDPVPGLILLWPSFLHHLVHPNLSDDLRVSVSFNVLLKNTSQYLPS